MHKIVLIGRLGGDPELRYMPNGNAVTSFSVASDNPRNGEKHTEWIRCSAFGKLAETANQYLSKGSQVYLEGPFHTNEYETRDGDKRFSVEMIVNNMQFLGGVASGSGYDPEEEVLDDHAIQSGTSVSQEDVDDLPF